ncbi:RNA-directed DNA polymerase [Actinomycetospora chibensis]|uniref:RNA-directed DNA polymerase n=1 Tax=Actinomycetospora chibensis TaxID=663606 RepID=A0ABV9RHV7_9PSEU|nr:RNA-directed DNA polymerase [Actinomycetospora chibensis]MDD7923869.1 RNA-directed DNA polymerase [Actinomycetospora chibensis]
MSAGLVAQLDVRAAVAAETKWEPDLLPQPLVDRFAADRVDLVSEHIEQLALDDEAFRSCDLLIAHKWTYGRRPVALVPFRERVLYRATVEKIKPYLPPVVRGDEAYRTFKQAPTSRGNDISHVVTTDIANFYSSIPIDQLGQHLKGRAGHFELITWLENFWREISGRYVGIPQVNEASETVAEAYADDLQRRILARGVTSVRYSDDFRLLTLGDKRAVRALEIFDDEARQLGLHVNERKTRTDSISDYTDWFQASPNLQGPVARARDAFIDRDLYSDSTFEPDEAQEHRDTATEMLNLWSSGSREYQEGEARAEVVRHAKTALGLLETIEDPTAIPWCEAIVRTEPQLTPAVARYLRTLESRHHERVSSALESLVIYLPLSQWQRVWMLYVIEVGGFLTDNAVIDWAKSNTKDANSEFLRAYSAWVLACNHRLEDSTWREAANGSTSLTSPYLAGALANCRGFSSTEKAQLVAPNFLDQQLFEWVVHNEEDIIPPIF